MTSLKARSLPRVREALARAERSRFYKQRMHRYSEEVGLQERLRHLEATRIMLLSKLKHDDLKLRMTLIQLRDEEQALLESDERMLDDVMKKIERHQKRTHAQIDKYKSDKARMQLHEKRKMWEEEEAFQGDWRWEFPKRSPQVKVDIGLIYPKMKHRSEFRKTYAQLTKRPESRLAEKCVQHLRDLQLQDSSQDLNVDFIRQLEQELLNKTKQSDPFISHPGNNVMNSDAVNNMLADAQETRRTLKMWKQEPSKETEAELSECIVKKKVRRKKLSNNSTSSRETMSSEQLTSDIDAVEKSNAKVRDAADSKENVSEQSPSVDVNKTDNTNQDTFNQQQSSSPVPPGVFAPKRKMSRLAKQLSKNFNPDDFSWRRQSLMKELEEQERLSEEERERRLQEFQDAWNEVLKCKYLRGYDPPSVTMPGGVSATDFVFGNHDDQTEESNDATA